MSTPQDGEAVDLFLCHTAANKDWVRSFAGRIEQETIDDRAVRVFFDEWDIAPGENILGRIDEGLQRARYVAIVLSPALTRAGWPTLEWQSQVYEDPTGKRGRIIPLIVDKFDPATCEPLEIPFALRILRYVDFSDSKRFEQQYQLLLARLRGQSARGVNAALVDRMALVNPSAGPDAASIVEEVLLANLFQAQLPPVLFSDITSASSFSEVRALLTGPFRTPFVLHGGRLYSFVPLDKALNPFRTLLTGRGPRVERTADLLKEAERSRHLVWLANDALRQRCFALSLRSPKGHRDLYYPTCSPGESRRFSWGRGAPLTLAKVGGGEKPLGVHHAASMRFIQIGSELNLLVEPRYFFTTDGSTPVDGRRSGRYSVQWGNREGNATVLRRTLMWPRLLAGGAMEISLETGGTDVLKISGVPRFGRSNLGILGDARDIQALLSGESAGEIFGTDAELDAAAVAHALGQLEVDDDEDPAEPDESVAELSEAASPGTHGIPELPF